MKRSFILRTCIILFSLWLHHSLSAVADIHVLYKERPYIITSFEDCYLGYLGELMITLSDGSQWIIDKKKAEEARRKISENWQVGDDIRLKENLEFSQKKKMFTLKNVRTEEVYLAELSTHCTRFSSGFFIKQIDENGYALVTSDGSLWSIGLMGAYIANRWLPKDRIIINKGDLARGEHYYLISVKDGSFCWGNLIRWRGD